MISNTTAEGPDTRTEEALASATSPTPAEEARQDTPEEHHER